MPNFKRKRSRSSSYGGMRKRMRSGHVPYSTSFRKKYAAAKKRRIARIRKAVGVERKCIFSGLTSQVPGNNSTSTTNTPDTQIIRVDPNSVNLNIQQGIRQHERIGNKVKLTNGKMTLCVWPRSDIGNNTNNLQYIRVVCFYDKEKPTETPTPFANLDFFQQSSATGSVGFTGQMYDLYQKINTDRYHVFWERSYKLGFADLQGSASGDPTYAYQSNNDFKAFYKLKFSLNKTCIKNLTWKDGYNEGTWRGCWIMAFGVAAASVGNGANALVANYSTQIEWNYIDA